jgi:hypothetical protein
MQFIELVMFVLVPIAILKVLSLVISRLTVPNDREVANRLIALNKAKLRPGMETVDWQKTNRAGDRTWAVTLRGQRRYSTMVVPAKKSDGDARVN